MTGKRDLVPHPGVPAPAWRISQGIVSGLIGVINLIICDFFIPASKIF
jgi:hypothetical protein